MDTPSALRDGPAGRHRASSDPLSRGGAFLDGVGLLSAEPNPFEQSFRPGNPPFPSDGTATPHGGRRARSTSPTSLFPRATPGGTQKLPPVSFMQTPSTELAAFGWGDSLRTGPLSPALLDGPAGASAPPGVAFDASFRTGLTPMVAGSAAGGPGAAGGNAAVSFPPPSPATAALFAMMTNNTPGTADAAAAAAAAAGLAGGGPRPHEGPNESNSFEASFARANSGDIPHVQTQPAPLNDLHRAALANQTRAGGSASGPPPPPGPSAGGYFAPQPHQAQNGAYPFAAPPGQPIPFSATPPQNSLDLLSQASFQNDDALVAAAALSGLATPGGGLPAAALLAAAGAAPPQQGAGIMPGSTLNGGPGAAGTGPANGGKAPSPAPSASGSATGRGKRAASSANVITSPASSGPTGKRARRSTAAAQEMEQQALLEQQELEAQEAAGKGKGKRAKRGAAKKQDEMDDMMGDEDMNAGAGEENAPPVPTQPAKGGRGRKKDTGETEEEKRKNFLERNRQAALKCRQRKKAWLQSLQTKVELLTTDNDQLQSTVSNLKEEVNSLRAILAAHANCPVAMGNAPPPPQGGPAPGMIPVGVGVPMMHPGHPHAHPHPHAPPPHPHEQMHLGVTPPARRTSLPGAPPPQPVLGMPPTSVPPPGYGPPPPGARY
ncbi:hypothetical protein JCM10213_004021 [Rhodosporidiobolus nylandii]